MNTGKWIEEYTITKKLKSGRERNYTYYYLCQWNPQGKKKPCGLGRQPKRIYLGNQGNPRYQQALKELMETP